MFDIGSWLVPKPPPEIGCVAKAYVERTEQAQKDLLLILEYLAERTERTTDDESIDDDFQRASRLCAMPYRSLEEAQKGEIWVLMNRLSGMIAPATVAGLRATRHGYAGWSGWPTLFAGVIGTFLIAVLLQTYTLFGTQTLDRLNTLNAEANEVFAQINTIEQHQPALYQHGLRLRDSDSDSAKATADLNDATNLAESNLAEYSHLHDRLTAIKNAKEDVFKSIYQWNAPWAAPIAFFRERTGGEYWGFDCSPDDKEPCKSWAKMWDDRLTGQGNATDLWKAAPLEHLQIRYGSEALARANLEVLRGLVLPVLYGALGAWVWLLRERYDQVRSRRLRSPVWGEYLQRVLLGAVFGATLGYLNLPSFLPDALANISLIGLAFIIGYNVEVVFWLFDQMFRNMREKRAEEQQERAKRRQLAERRAGPAPPPSGAPA